jgi:hypothetical protein
VLGDRVVVGGVVVEVVVGTVVVVVVGTVVVVRSSTLEGGVTVGGSVAGGSVTGASVTDGLVSSSSLEPQEANTKAAKQIVAIARISSRPYRDSIRAPACALCLAWSPPKALSPR